MDIGTSIVIGCAIFGVIEFIIRMFGRSRQNCVNPNTKTLQSRLNSMEKKFNAVRYIDTCDAFREGFNQQLTGLRDTVDVGFKHVNDQLQEIRKSLDRE